MPKSLVFGASGAIGRFLVPRLLAAHHDVIALSRQPRSSGNPRLRWIAGDLFVHPLERKDIDTIYSLGPLDGCAQWLQRADIAGKPRVVAIGSMSAQTKQTSADAHERQIADRLLAAERELAAAADARGCAWTVLRATLIYGAGLDRSLTPMVRFAQRWRLFPYVARAPGLRQPVHADDLALACIAAASSWVTTRRVYALGGGERLAFGTMLARVHASLPFATIALPVPLAVVHAGAGLARMLPAFRAASTAAVQRMREDLVVDHSQAIEDFGWAPREFRPDAQAWTAPPLP